MRSRQVYLSGLLACALVLACAVTPVAAAGSCTVTSARGASSPRFESYTAVCTTTAGGAVSANPITIVGGGRLVQVRITPGTSGNQPSDDFDVTINDAAGVDAINALGADQDNVVGKFVTRDPPVFVEPGATLDIVVANGGNAKQITVVLVFQP